MRAAPSAARMRESILTSLRSMCATRRGSVFMQPDYGIPDVSEMVSAFPDAISELVRALKHTISIYEPRLTDVRVVHVPDPNDLMTVRIDITARLAAATGNQDVRFETRLDAGRKFDVR